MTEPRILYVRVRYEEKIAKIPCSSVEKRGLTLAAKDSSGSTVAEFKDIAKVEDYWVEDGAAL